MRQKRAGRPSSSAHIIKAIKRKTRKQYHAEEKIRIVLDGLRGEDSIAELLKHARGWGRTQMRYPACEKLEIIGRVERSHLPAQQTLAMRGMPRTTFYRG